MDKSQSRMISRREFLIIAGISTVAGVQVACNLPGTANLSPTSPPPAQPLPTENIQSPSGPSLIQPYQTENVLSPTSTTEPNQPQTQTAQPTANTPEAQHLQATYNLSAGNAETFWVFIANRDAPLGRKKIASNLNISRNTLKDHITRILRHVRSQGNPDVKTLNEAVAIAVRGLAREGGLRQVS